MTDDTTKAPEGGLGSSADADTHRATGPADVVFDEPMGDDGRFLYRTTFTGERHIVDATSGFVWLKLPYDYRYTDNATQRRQAQTIIAALTATTAISVGTEKPSGFAVDHEAKSEAALWKAHDELARRDAVDHENHEALRVDAMRYRYLRSRDAGPEGQLPPPGLFIGQVPENLILTESDADEAIDAILAALQSKGGEP